MTQVLYVSLKVVLAIHEMQLHRHGGAAGIRNQAGLEAAVEQPKHTWGEADLYPTLFEKASCYAFHISEAQAFVDGNKRAAIHTALTFLKINGFSVDRKFESQLYDAMIAISAGEMNKDGLAQLLRELAVDSLNTDDQP